MQRYPIAAALLFMLMGGGCVVTNPPSNVEYFSHSIEYHNQAARLINESGSDSVSAEVQTAMDYNRRALEKAVLVNIDKLNEDYATFGDHYNNEFVAGLKMMISGYDEGNDADFLQGQVLVDRWGSWYEENFNKIRSL